MLTLTKKQLQVTNAGSTEATQTKKRLYVLSLILLGAVLLSVSMSYSQITSTFTSVFTQNQKGTIVMVGNTLMTCSASSTCTNAQNGGTYNNNDFSMINIDIDGISNTSNSSSADFTLGSNQTVIYAGLFWSGVSGSSQRNKVKFSTPASGGYIDITGTISSTSYGYQGYADVTSYVQAAGSGTYMTGGVRNTTGTNQWAGWVLVVVIQDPTAMLRNLTVFKGLGLVNSSNTSINIPISGFKTPLSGTVNTQLGIVVWDGDRVYTGDSLKLNSTVISNSLNPTNNFFNSSITNLNTTISDRNPSYVNTMGLDADIVDASNIIPNGATTATIRLTTGGESYMPGVVTNAIQLFAPDIQTTKIARDLTPGFYEPTDTVEYTLTSTNIGNDGATSLILLDTITSIGTYVPGSLSVVSGANTGTKTDASGDDQAEYNSTSKVITFRLGTGANSSSGGSLAVNDSTKVRFKMVVSAAAADRSLIHNQGTLSFTSATLVQPFVVKTFSSDTVVVWASDLKVTKVASASTIQAGNNVTYTVKVKNYGKKNATSVALSDSIPVGITYISHTATKGTYSNFSGAWSIGSLVVGDSAVLTIQANAPTFGTYINKAMVTASTLPDPTMYDDTARVTISVIDSIPPSAPTVSYPANGSYINTTTPTFSGFAEALSKVYIYVDGVLKDSTTADALGNWSKVSATLTQGSHTIKASAKDAGGNVSPFSSTNTFTVDSIAPATPVITIPTAGQVFTISNPTFTGTAEANVKVRIYIGGVLRDSTFANGSGNWTYVSTGFVNGTYSLSVRAVDLAYNTSSLSASRSFTITDNTVPTTPVVLTPANGSSINTTTPLITGTSDVYNKIRIYIDNVLRDSVTATVSGTWSYTSPVLTAGSHNVKVYALDGAGNISSVSNTNTFTIDVTAPSAPVVSVPVNGSYVTTTTPTFSGTAEANSKVRIYVDNVLVDSATTNGSGAWTKVSAAIGQGSHTIKVTATDAAGNTSVYSNTNTFTVDSTVPATPVVAAPANGSYLTTTTPTYSGTAEANSKVRIYVDGVLRDSVTADGSGNWTKVSAVLTQGSHNVKVTASDAAGNTSGFSNINTFTIDTVAPSAPVVVLPANATTVASTTPTFSGTAEANSKVRIYVDNVLVDSTTADSLGNWSDVSAVLAQGSHTIKATSTDAAGNTSGYSNINTFTVDTVAPSAPVVSAPTNGSYLTTTTPTFSGTAEANSKVRIYVDNVLVDSTTASGVGAWSDVSATLAQGSHTVKVTATDAAGNTSVYSNIPSFTIDTVAPNAPVTVLPANGSSVSTTTPTFSGTAEANSKVRIYVDGVLKDSVTADGSGNWSKASAVLTQGSHNVKATATDAAGNTSVFSNINTFTVDTVAPSAPVVVAPANSSVVTTTTPTFSGTAEANSKVRIYVDGVLRDSVTADGSGNWTKASATLTQGSHTIRVTATDAAGNTSVNSNTNTFTVDSVAPSAPVVSVPVTGTTVATTTPTFSGTAEANSKVRIYVDNVLVDSTTATAGGAWSDVSATLAQGSHTVKVTATDAAGNTSVFSNIPTFTVDTVAPSAPVVTAPANGATVATATPAITGTSEANAKVRIYIDGVLRDSVTANGSGAWTYTSPTLTQASHTVYATATDAVGNTSVNSSTNTFTVDTTAPSAPVVSAPVTGTTVATTTPTFSGTAEANSKVRIYVDNVLVDSTTATAGGAWTKVSATLAQGSHTIKVTATDAAGNTSVYSNIPTFTVDTVAPSAPVVTAPANGATVATATPAITGTSEANAKVRIYIDGVLRDSVTANGSGAWTYTSPTLTQASHTVYATATDAVGNTSGNSSTNTFTVDTTAPSAPVVSAPVTGTTVATTTPTFSGTAEANSKVRIYVDNVLVDSTTATAGGAWTKVSATLAQGSHTVKVTATDAAGNTSVFSNIPTFTVDTVAPSAPVVTAPANGAIVATATPAITGTSEANAKVRIYIDGVLRDSVTANGSGAWTYTSPTLTQASHTVYSTATDAVGNTSGNSSTNTFTVDTTAPSAPVVSAPVTGTTVATTTPTFSGTAEANSKVRIYVDNVLVDSTTATAGGAWTKVSATLAQGSHTVKVTATDAAGNTSVFSNIPTFTVDTVAPSAPVVTAPANGATVATATPAITGTSEANAKVRIYIDGVLRDSVTANGSGAWTYTSPTLTQASHTVYATATDAVGNTSVNSSTNTFTVDTTAPNAPVVNAPVTGTTVATTTPTFSGTAEANSKVRIYVDNVLVDSTTATAGGAWTKVSATLAQGSHTVKVTATDAAGNTSVYSNIPTFTVDTVAPSAPVVTAPANGATVATATPAITGTSEANAKVRIYIDGVLRDSVTANGSGAWTYTSPTLTQASHTVYATATDAVGNTSVNSSTNTFTVDTTAPSAPVVSAPVTGTTVATTTPTFSGTAEANSKVRIYVDNVLVDSTTATAGGAWTKVSATLAQGSHTVKVTATDAAGNTSVYSNIPIFTVDTVAPSTPVVSAPANGSTVATTTPTFSGTAEANSKVRIYVDNVLVDSTTTDGSGNWTKTSATLAQGSHTIKVTATDAVGNTSGYSTTNTFTVDTVAPSAPVVVVPANGATVATTTPTFSGTAEANSKVRIYVDGVLVDSATTDGSGNWSKVSAALAQGSHTIKALAIDAVGNTSAFSSTNTFTVDSVAPSAPVVVLPANGSSVATTTPTFSGTAEASSKVRLYVDGVLVDSTTADGSGNWSKVSATLTAASHTIKATATDAAGNTSGFSNINTFTIDVTAPSAPVVTAPTNGSTVATSTPTFTGTSEANAKVRIYVDNVLRDSTTANGSGAWSKVSAILNNGSHTIKVTALDAAGNTSVFSNTNTFTVNTSTPTTPVIVTPANNSSVATTTPVISGTGDANDTVKVYVDGVLVGSVLADGSGNWTYTSSALSQASHTTYARQVNAAGTSSANSSTTTFTVDITAPSAPVVSAPTNGLIVTTTTPTFSGTAEANSKVRIYVDNVLVDSTTANGSGVWSKTSATLAQGSHTIKVTAVDAAGNTSAYSNVPTFTVDTVAPNAPVVTAPADNSSINTQTPTFTGTSEASAKVRIYVDGVLVDSTTANGSGAWSKVSATLTVASHTIKVTAVDAGGNVSVFSNINTFTIDISAPSAPVVSAPVTGSTVATTTPTFSGTAEANSKVRIYVDNTLVDSTTADASGNWSKASAALAQGSHTVKVTSTDAAGNTSAYSNIPTFTVDTTAPSVPVTVMPANASTVATTTPTFSGTAEANSKVRLYVDGVLVDSTTADASGNWSKVSAALSQGSHTIKATATDAGGNTSGFSNINTFTVDTTAPNAPVVVAPANGSTVATTTPIFSGTAEASSKVRIYVDNVLVDSVTTDGSGNWSKVSAALAQGSHTIKATSTDAVGNTSGYSNINTFTIDTVAPNAPVTIAPANGSTVATTTPTFSGTAEANSKVRIYVDNVLVDSTTASGLGAWSKASVALAQGSHTLKVTATDAIGNTSVFSNINTFTVDTVAPNAPVVSAPADGSTVATTTPTFSGTAEANSKVRIYVDNVLVDSTTASGLGAWSKASAVLTQGSHTIKVTATDAVGNTSVVSNINTFTVDTVAPSTPVTVAPANGSTVATTTPTFSGTAEANSKVRIYVDNVLVDSTTASGLGAWSKVSAVLAQGSHTIKVTSVDGAGNASVFSNINTFTVDTVAPNVPVVIAPANGSTVATTTPTFSGTAEANSKVRLYVDNVLVDSVTTDGSGNWSKASAALAQGSHTIKATSTDASGNTSGFSNINTFTVDTVAPNAPVVVLPADGSTVPTTTPTFSGTAEANSTVRIYVDGTLVDSTTANGSGAWSKVSAALAQGSHTIKVTSTDGAGTTSVFSNINTFTVDTVAPNAPVVVLPADGSTIATTTPTFSGTAEAASKVRLYVDGTLVDSTNADGSGNWSKVSAALSQGSHTIKATSTDAVGNTSGFSNTNTFTIDTVAPNAPVVVLPADGSLVGTTTPLFTGTAEANSKVRIYVDGTLVDSTVADGSGNWSKTSAVLAQGSHTIKATSVDAAGNTSGFSNINTFTIDSIAPNAPVVVTPADNSYSNTATPTYSGTAEANTKVRLYVDGVLVDSSTADGSGNWTKVSATLADGSHTIKATSTDATGNTSVFSNINTFTIDTNAPNAPVVVTPADNSYVTTTTPTFDGTAEANSKVRIYVDGILVDSSTADGSGNWTAVSASLAQGSHTIKATSTDAAGNTSVFSNTNTFIIDTVAPNAPVVVTPLNGSTIATTTPTYTGTAEATTKVRIYVDGSLVDSTTADALGNWSTVSAVLTQGSHDVKATSTDAAGNTSVFSNTNTFTVQSTPPPVAITTPAEGSTTNDRTPGITGTTDPNLTVIVSVDGIPIDTVIADAGGNWASSVISDLSDGAHTVGASVTSISGITSTALNHFTVDTVPPVVTITQPAATYQNSSSIPTIGGGTESGALLVIFIDGVPVDTIQVGTETTWTSDATGTLPDGPHTITVVSTDPAGNTTTVSKNIIVDTVPPIVSVSNPADGSTTTDNTPLLSGAAEPNAYVIVYIDSVRVDSMVAVGGTWSSANCPALSDGPHTVYATARDSAGNQATSAINHFIVDNSAPAVAITTPANGSSTNNPQPPITGTAEVGSTMILRLDGVPVDTVVIPANGQWSYNPPVALSSASHTAIATAYDAVGNSATATSTFTIDANPPAVVITSPLNGAVLNTATVTIVGTAEAFSTLRLYLDDTLVTTISVNGSGNWSYLTHTLAQGAHRTYATATDGAGNMATSNLVNFTIDSQAPTVSVVTPVNGSVSTNNLPLFTGTAEQACSVKVYVDSVLVGSFLQDATQTWSIQSGVMADGFHRIFARATDASGNTAVSSTNIFRIVTVPVLTSISPNAKRVGADQFTMMLTGQYFLPTSIGMFDGVARTTTYISPTQLLVDVPATDMAIVDTIGVTVFTPAPGGGTSQSFSFTVLGATVSGTIFYDVDKNGTKDGTEPGLQGWAVNAVGTNPANNQLAITDINGNYTLTNLTPDIYTITEVSKPLWTLVAPVSGSYTAVVDRGFDTTGFNFANYVYADTGTYRTFVPSDLAQKTAVSRKKCNGFKFAFDFTNRTGQVATGIYVEFNNVVTQFTNFYPFEEVQDLGQNAQDYKFLGVPVQDGQTIRVEGYSVVNPCKIRINKWWWTRSDSNISKKKSEGPMKPAWFSTSLPMPNAANVRDEVFGTGMVISYGLIAGIPNDQNSRKYAWVDIRKSADFYGSLIDKAGLQSGTPRGFTNGVKAGAIVGRIKKMPPSKFNNRLFGELLTLKFNIWASRVGVTPVGFGELIYQESDNPLRGMMIKDIGLKADSMMTYWKDVLPEVYTNLDTTIRKLNLAFNGPIDTVQFAVRTKLPGIKSLSDVSFLRPNYSVPPATAPEDSKLTEYIDDTPQKFELHQNYPNPFNPSTTIAFDLPVSATVTLKLYDILGKEVATLLDAENYDEGNQSVEFTATNLPTGAYFYRLSAVPITNEDGVSSNAPFVSIKKMLLVK